MIHANAYRGHVVCPPLAQPKVWVREKRAVKPRKSVTSEAWTKAQDEALFDYRAKGVQFDRIARILGRSKGSCISRWHRVRGRAA